MTKQKPLVQELEESREELAKLVVRDMKTPLAGLANLLELADRASVKHFRTEASQYVNEALGATETLEELVGFLLGVRKMIAGKIELDKKPWDLSLLARKVVEGLTEAAQAAGVTVEVRGDACFASCDLEQVTRVIRHLIRVAINANPSGKQVVVQTTVENNQARLSVTTDPGVATGPSDGHGLGLTYCRLVVEAHGGKFETDAANHQWWFSLPGMASSFSLDTAPIIPMERSRRYLGPVGVKDDEHPHRRSIISLGTRHQFAIAVALISTIPLLALAYLLGDDAMVNSMDRTNIWLLLPTVVVPVGLGVVLLARHISEMNRLRRYLELMSKGESPTVGINESSDDFTAIKQFLGVVIRQTDERVKIIEAQSKALLQAEQQRVMSETVGAACHHLGQPATVIRVYLDLMKKAEVSPEIRGMIEECQSAVEEVANVLHRLQGVGKYQTEPYLEKGKGGSPRKDERILKI